MAKSMTGVQRRLYRSFLRIGRSDGVNSGARSWTYYAPNDSSPSVSAGVGGVNTVTMYVLPAFLIKKQTAQPAIGIYAADFWGVGGEVGLEAPGVIVNGGKAYLIQGIPDTSEGFPIYPLVATQVPDAPETNDGWQL